MRVLTLLVTLAALICIAPKWTIASVPDCITNDKQKSDQTSRDIDAEIVSDIENRGGNSDFTGLSSNQIIKMLKNKEYALEISGAEAVAYTKKGITVIVGLEGNPKGHIAEVAPVEMVDSKSEWGMVPMIFSPDGKDGLKPLSEKFSPKGVMPKFYVRIIDIQEPPEK